MVRKIIALITFILINSLLFATELEDIWELCRTKNSDVRSMEYDLNQAQFKFKNDKDVNGSTYFGIESTVSFPRDYEKGIRFIPTGYEEAFTFRRNLNSSTSLSVLLKNSLSNEYVYYHEDKYMQSTSVSMTLNQSLTPYWLREESEDPYYLRLNENIELSKSEKDILERQAILDATMCYIKLRYYFRMSEFYRQAINEYKNLINVLEELGDDISYEYRQDISDFRNTMWNYVLSLSDIEENFESQKKLLSDICGTEIVIDSIKKLPDSFDKIFDYDIDDNRLDVKIRLLQLERSLSLQEESPSLSLSAGVTNKSEVKTLKDYIDGFSEDKNWNWYIAVSLDLSSLFSSEIRIADNEYKVAIEKFSVEREQLKVQKQSKIVQYESLLSKAKERMRTSADMLVYYYEKKVQAKQMYDRGALSEIALKQYTLSYAQMNVAYESIKDEIWLYGWILENII